MNQGPKQTDELLAADFQSGSELAFETLVDRYTNRVYAFIFRLSGDRELSEDATQEAFVKAWKAINSYDTERPFRPWLFQIARNATIDLMRKRKDRTFSSLSDDDDFSDGLADDTSGIEEILDTNIDTETAMKALQKLSTAMRAVVLLHDVEDLTFQEIASASGESLNTVKSRYRRALARLKEIMHQKKER
ncbi:MAG TPA: RNA polymerase sigma factor [Candidatus Paceibacterota bacterium]|jgi:RNA polymerase sigma factor, sigma-70 family